MVSHILVKLMIRHINGDIAQLDIAIDDLRAQLRSYIEEGLRMHMQMSMSARAKWADNRKMQSEKIIEYEIDRMILRADVARLKAILEELN
jgi:hypothetical protein